MYIFADAFRSRKQAGYPKQGRWSLLELLLLLCDGDADTSFYPREVVEAHLERATPSSIQYEYGRGVQ